MKLTTTDYVYVATESIVALLSVVSNAMVLAVIKRYRVFRGITNYFIGSLAVADLLVGILLIPTVILPYAGMPREFYSCLLLNSVVVILTNISILNLDAIAVERYVTVLMHKLNQRIDKKWFSAAVIALCWVLAILLGLIPLMGWHEDREEFVTKFNRTCSFMAVINLSYMVHVIFFGIVAPSILFAFFVYFRIFRFVRQHVRKNTSLDGRKGVSGRKMELQATRALFRVVLFFALCWLPLSLHNTATIFFPEEMKIVPFPVLLSFIVLSHSNSFLNPIIYVFSSERFKQALQGLLGNRSVLFPTTTIVDMSKTLPSKKEPSRDVRVSSIDHATNSVAPTDPRGSNALHASPETVEPT